MAKDRKKLDPEHPKDTFKIDPKWFDEKGEIIGLASRLNKSRPAAKVLAGWLKRGSRRLDPIMKMNVRNIPKEEVDFRNSSPINMPKRKAVDPSFYAADPEYDYFTEDDQPYVPTDEFFYPSSINPTQGRFGGGSGGWSSSQAGKSLTYAVKDEDALKKGYVIITKPHVKRTYRRRKDWKDVRNLRDETATVPSIEGKYFSAEDVNADVYEPETAVIDERKIEEEKQLKTHEERQKSLYRLKDIISELISSNSRPTKEQSDEILEILTNIEPYLNPDNAKMTRSWVQAASERMFNPTNGAWIRSIDYVGWMDNARMHELDRIVNDFVLKPLPEKEQIKKAAVILIDKRTGKLVAAKPTGSYAYDVFGGTIEPGETPLQAALRELKEEAGIVLGPENVRFLGNGVRRKSTDPHEEVPPAPTAYYIAAIDVDPTRLFTESLIDRHSKHGHDRFGMPEMFGHNLIDLEDLSFKTQKDLVPFTDEIEKAQVELTGKDWGWASPNPKYPWTKHGPLIDVTNFFGLARINKLAKIFGLPQITENQSGTGAGVDQIRNPQWLMPLQGEFSERNLKDATNYFKNHDYSEAEIPAKIEEAEKELMSYGAGLGLWGGNSNTQEVHTLPYDPETGTNMPAEVLYIMILDKGMPSIEQVDWINELQEEEGLPPHYTHGWRDINYDIRHTKHDYKSLSKMVVYATWLWNALEYGPEAREELDRQWQETPNIYTVMGKRVLSAPEAEAIRWKLRDEHFARHPEELADPEKANSKKYWMNLVMQAKHWGVPEEEVGGQFIPTPDEARANRHKLQMEHEVSSHAPTFTKQVRGKANEGDNEDAIGGVDTAVAGMPTWTDMSAILNTYRILKNIAGRKIKGSKFHKLLTDVYGPYKWTHGNDPVYGWRDVGETVDDTIKHPLVSQEAIDMLQQKFPKAAPKDIILAAHKASIFQIVEDKLLQKVTFTPGVTSEIMNDKDLFLSFFFNEAGQADPKKIEHFFNYIGDALYFGSDELKQHILNGYQQAIPDQDYPAIIANALNKLMQGLEINPNKILDLTALPYKTALTKLNSITSATLKKKGKSTDQSVNELEHTILQEGLLRP